MSVTTAIRKGDTYTCKDCCAVQIAILRNLDENPLNGGSAQESESVWTLRVQVSGSTILKACLMQGLGLRGINALVYKHYNVTEGWPR